MPIKLIKGSIRFNKHIGVYEARLTINYKTISFYSKDKNECIKKANNFYKTQYKGIDISQVKKSMLLNEWIDEWFELYKKPKVKEITQKTMLSAINKHIKPYFEKIRLIDINALTIDKFLNRFENSRHKETISTIISDCLSTAYRKEKIKKPIHEQITKYKHEREEGHSLTEQEEKILLENIPKVKNAETIMFAYLTGCRKHGVFNLKSEDINFSNKTIHIRETKTKTSDRIFPMTNKLEQFLKTLNLKEEYVFNISDRQQKNMIEELSSLCGFRIHFKDMRTTFSSRAREKGVAPEVLKKLLGHKNYGVTEKYYVKISDKFEMNEIHKLDT